MLLNGKFAFCQFPMLFNGNLRIKKLGGARTYVHTYVRMDGCMEIHPCVLQDIGPLGPLPKKDKSKMKGLERAKEKRIEVVFLR